MDQEKKLLHRAKYLTFALCRRNSRMSRGELAEKSSISAYQIEKYEHGKKDIPYDELDILLRVLNISEEAFMNQIVSFVIILTREMRTCKNNKNRIRHTN